MEKLIIGSYEEFEKYVGQELGVSDYVELPQERINLFADATLDHQWIHVDTEKAAVESRYPGAFDFLSNGWDFLLTMIFLFFSICITMRPSRAYCIS